MITYKKILRLLDFKLGGPTKDRNLNTILGEPSKEFHLHTIFPPSFNRKMGIIYVIVASTIIPCLAAMLYFFLLKFPY